jgi:hypothetical protein
MWKISRSAAVAVALGAAGPGVAAGCGDEGGAGAGDRAGEYDDPADFDRGLCTTETAIDSIAPAGIWHVDTTSVSYGPSVHALRIDPSAGGFTALLFGVETDDVRLSADDLFVRLETRAGGREDVVAIDLCAVEDDGSLSGSLARCSGDECVVGQAHGYPIEPLDEPEAENMTLVAEWAGAEGEPWDGRDVTYNVRHLGTVAYVARGTDGLHVVDLADPAHPADLGHLPARYPPDEYYNDVKITETDGGRVYALLASNLRGVVVVDVTDPGAPTEVGLFPAPPGADGAVNVHSLFGEGERMYVADISIAGLEIFDISDPVNPARLGAFVDPDVGSLGGFVHDLFVQDGVAYLDYWNLGLVVVDAADPAAPAVLGVFDDYPRRTSHSNWVTEAGGRRVAVHGDEDFDAHVRVIDVDPDSATAFQEIGAYQTRPPVSVHNIMAVGELALVTYYQDGLRVLDLADPTSPVEVAHFDTWPGPEPGYGQSFYEGAIGVDHDAERELVLVADTHRGLLVLAMDGAVAAAQRSRAASRSASSGSGVWSARSRPTGQSAAWRRK